MIKNHPITTFFLKPLASVQITVVCLFLLFILTFWGTIAQVEQGLYLAQMRFFNSYYFFAAGFIPFPGAQLVMWVLFVNLLAATITRFMYYRKWSYSGILIIHFGLLVYLVSGFVTLHLAKESHVTLAEGQATNVSASYTQWEIAYWKEEGDTQEITAIDTDGFKKGTVVRFTNVPWQLSVVDFYENSAAFTKTLPASGAKLKNDSGITLLQPRKVDKEREKNIAGGIFQLTTKTDTYQIILYGTEDNPTVIEVDGQRYYFSLRNKRSPLPFTIKLDEFKAEFHPGTQMARSYESWVEVIKGDTSRKAHIYMNNPLREKEYALYQSSYSVDDFGRKYSTLAVVQNAASVMPYVASFIVFFGLMLHFIMHAMALMGKKE